MRIAVIDGQGGGIGKHITEALVQAMPEDTKIYALGTNAVATAQMMKGGASEGATGENAICYMAGKVDIICGTVSILCADSMLGEVSPAVARAVGSSDAKKYLLPLNRSDVHIAGVAKEPMPHLISDMVDKIVKENF